MGTGVHSSDVLQCLSCMVYQATPLHKFTAIRITPKVAAEPALAEEVLKH